jgi:hypothetical protein
MRNTDGKNRDLFGIMLTGPMYFIFKKRDFKFTKRETLGWLFVGALMIVGPIVPKLFF